MDKIYMRLNVRLQKVNIKCNKSFMAFELNCTLLNCSDKSLMLWFLVVSWSPFQMFLLLCVFVSILSKLYEKLWAFNILLVLLNETMTQFIVDFTFDKYALPFYSF